jgi:uncharacterized protein YqeY
MTVASASTRRAVGFNSVQAGVVIVVLVLSTRRLAGDAALHYSGCGLPLHVPQRAAQLRTVGAGVNAPGGEAMREAVNQALKEAMKGRDAARTGTLRLISAAIKERDIDARTKGREVASDDELLAALSKMIRQREESAKIYGDGGRPELAAKERGEIEVIRGFLPKQMSEDEVREAAKAAIAETGAASPRDMGKAMALLKERHSGAMDFGRASAVVKGLLG